MLSIHTQPVKEKRHATNGTIEANINLGYVQMSCSVTRLGHAIVTVYFYYSSHSGIVENKML